MFNSTSIIDALLEFTTPTVVVIHVHKKGTRKVQDALIECVI